MTVSDGGPGIPEAILGKVFEPFVTTRNEGTGLGLAIVQQILEHHGGSISVENRGGAVFSINLPRHC
jgi:two-component system C4-dicarboxylate transport sensor histidine kinase DctB